MQSKRFLPLAVVLLAVLAVYCNAFGNAFHFDDFHAVTDNPAVRSLGNLPRIAHDATAFSVLPANQTYRPLVTASLALDYALGHGYVPFWFHLSTFLWFLVLLWVLSLWAETLFENAEPGGHFQWLALGLAAWFGLHPAMAETVNYVIQRGDLYCTLGCVAALVLYSRYPQQRRYGGYLLPFALAMLSKPPAAVFPVLLLFYLFFFEEAGLPLAARCRKSAVGAVPAAGLTALLLWLQSAMTPRSYAPSILSAAAYRAVQPYVWLRYFGALFLPLHLNVDTDLQPMTTVTTATVAGFVFLACLLGLLVFCSRRRRLYPIAYGLLWFVLTQLPTSLYTLSEVENDHRMFFSFPGLMLAVVWALHLGYREMTSRRGNRWLPRLAAGLCALALSGYAYGAHRRNAVWHDEASLWADDAAKSPHNGRGLMIYGLTRMNAGDYGGALTLFSRALVYTPNYATLEINLGVVNGLLADTGQPGRNSVAEGHFRRALLLAPDDDLPHAYYGRWLLQHGRLPEAEAQLSTAVGLNAQRPMQRDLLLSAYRQSGELTAARTLAEETLRAIPDDAAALAVVQGVLSPAVPGQAASLINASLAAYRAGQFQQSIQLAQQALGVDPHSAEAWNNVGAGYGALRQWQPAVAAEEHALQLNPKLQIAANNLRWFRSQESGAAQPKTAADYVELSLRLNQSGRFQESLVAAQKAIALDPHSAEAWNNIAAGEEALRQWDAAIAAARQAVALRPDFQLAKNNLQWSLEQQAKSQGR